MAPTFLVGDWYPVEKKGSEEHWAQVGDVLVGVSLSKGFFELLHVAGDRYVAQPAGGEPTVFRAAPDEAGSTWTNPEHDFPKRISYRRTGDAMRANADTLAFSWTLGPPPAKLAQEPPLVAGGARLWWDATPLKALPEVACEADGTFVSDAGAWRVGRWTRGEEHGACVFVWTKHGGDWALAAAAWWPSAS